MFWLTFTNTFDVRAQVEHKHASKNRGISFDNNNMLNIFDEVGLHIICQKN